MRSGAAGRSRHMTPSVRPGSQSNSLKDKTAASASPFPVRRAQRSLLPELPNWRRMRALNQSPPSVTLLDQENVKTLRKSPLFKQNLGFGRQIPSQVRRESFFIMVATIPRIATVSDGQHFTTQTLRTSTRTPHVPCGRGHEWRLLACPGRASARGTSTALPAS